MNLKRSERQTKQKKDWIFIAGAFLLIILGTLAFFIFKILTEDKFIYVNRANDNSAEIIVVNESYDSSVKYLLPPDLELESANGYGIYKISSLWVLSDKDDNHGGLLTRTILKNMYLPIYYWNDGKRSNMNIYQRIKANFVSRHLKKYDKILNLNNITNTEYINFIDSEISNENLRIEIKDFTGSLDTLNKISKIIDVLGNKIASNSKGYDDKLDCEIEGGSSKAALIFQNIFSCEKVTNGGQTISLKFGAKFAERF